MHCEWLRQHQTSIIPWLKQGIHSSKLWTHSSNYSFIDTKVPEERSERQGQSTVTVTWTHHTAEPWGPATEWHIYICVLLVSASRMYCALDDHCGVTGVSLLSVGTRVAGGSLLSVGRRDAVHRAWQRWRKEAVNISIIFPPYSSGEFKTIQISFCQLGPWKWLNMQADRGQLSELG